VGERIALQRNSEVVPEFTTRDERNTAEKRRKLGQGYSKIIKV
jgi:hypothetical protein